MTNREKLAQKSNEEIGKFIEAFDSCESCQILRFCIFGKGQEADTCREAIALWLGEEVSE